MAKLKFRGGLVRMDQYVCLVLPGDLCATWGDGYRIPVCGTLNGYPVRTSIFKMRDGDRMFIVNKEMQKGGRVGLGDDVTVVLDIDDDRRAVAVPPDLARALGRARPAKAVFEKLPFSHQTRYVAWIDEAKRPETRARRVGQTVERLLADAPKARR